MLDLHCHILPAVDDGASDMDAALAMARVLVATGFRTIAASPHLGEGPGGDVAPRVAQDARGKLQAALTLAGIPLEILANSEHHVTPELFSRIDQQCPGAPAIGGVASGGADLGENRLVLNDEVFHTGIVGVVVWGAISIRTVVSQGCKPIGDRYVVTKAERNIIYELGGAPTLERLQTILQGLGADEARQAAMALQVGVAFDEHRERLDRGDFLIRGLLGADQQSGGVAVSDLVKEGQTVQFHVRDAQSASEELNLLLAKDRVDFPKEVPKGALLFSCNGRGRRFFAEPHHDISAVQKRVGSIPVAGFFAAGEIGPVGGQNFIHGYTASVALFSEPTEASPSHQPHSS